MDTITFAEDLAGATIRLALGQITITDPDGLTIDGGPAGVTISGDANGDDVTLEGGITDVAASLAASALADNSRIFNATAGSLTLQGLTLTGGRTSARGEGGGAVRAMSDLTLMNSTVAGNGTAGDRAYGGGVNGSAVWLINSMVAGNSTAGYFAGGGGVYGTTVTLSNSTVFGNSTAGRYAAGGGVSGSFDSTVTLTNSTVSGNSTMGVGAYGGGVHGQIVTLENSTVSGNSTMSERALGGGAFSWSELTLANSIILGNVAQAASGAEVGLFDGGQRGPAATLTLTGGNILGREGGVGAVVFSGGSILGDTTAAAVFADTETIAGGVVAGVLVDNGGPVRTIALRTDAANPALDASIGGTAADARGMAAVDLPGVGASGAGGAVRDLGAYELKSLEAPPAGQFLIVRAAGTGGPASAPAFEVRVDGVVVATETIGAPGNNAERRGGILPFEEFTFDLGAAPKPSRVEVVYVNDRADPQSGEDLNLVVDWIELNGVRFESELHGLYVRANGVEIGAVETLFWNGALAFDTASPPPPLMPSPSCPPQSLTVRAAGAGGAASSPGFHVLVDGARVGTETISTPGSNAERREGALAFDEFVFDLGNIPTPSTVQVVYFNDGTDPETGENLNLVVDWIELNEVRFESETDAFYTRVNGVEVGPTDTLFWNGVLEFSDLMVS